MLCCADQEWTHVVEVCHVYDKSYGISPFTPTGLIEAKYRHKSDQTAPEYKLNVWFTNEGCEGIFIYPQGALFSCTFRNKMDALLLENSRRYYQSKKKDKWVTEVPRVDRS
jgi:hypothetical protein